jgi:hypothetical protein
MKIEKQNPELFYLLGYLLLELIIRIWQFGFYFLRNLANSGHFLHEKSFKSYFLGQNLATIPVRFGINWQHDFRTSLKFQPLFWLAQYINSQK